METTRFIKAVLAKPLKLEDSRGFRQLLKCRLQNFYHPPFSSMARSAICAMIHPCPSELLRE